jgi:hypothetical protein
MDTEMFCTYDGRREEVLVAYLYDDITPVERATFERHLMACAVCRTELDALTEVRGELAGWNAPDSAAGVGGKAPRSALRIVDTPPPASGWRRLADAPVWMQAAAAMLVIGTSLGLANINLTYSRQAGLTVSTGWMQTSPAAPVQAAVQPAATSPSPATAPPADAALSTAAPSAEPWRSELAALDQKIAQALAAQTPDQGPSSDTALLQRVRALIQESEQRQQRELALRVAEIARDAQAQRQADLVRIDRSLGMIQRSTGVEVMRTQQQLNSLAQRVSQRQ